MIRTFLTGLMRSAVGKHRMISFSGVCRTSDLMWRHPGALHNALSDQRLSRWSLNIIRYSTHIWCVCARCCHWKEAFRTRQRTEVCGSHTDFVFSPFHSISSRRLAFLFKTLDFICISRAVICVSSPFVSLELKHECEWKRDGDVRDAFSGRSD